jgi:hypothetical protein
MCLSHVERCGFVADMNDADALIEAGIKEWHNLIAGQSKDCLYARCLQYLYQTN